MEPIFVYMTASSADEAKKIGRALVEARLAACVNVLDRMTSFYWWQGQIEEGHEAVLIAKTTRGHLDALTAKVKTLHSYTVPCVVGLPIQGGNEDFLDWIGAETRDAKGALTS
jgi:periplasmic divalent cation tolerance protein